MIGIGATVKLPKIDIDCPDTRFWLATGMTEAKEIHKNTLAGRDVDGQQFKPYSEAYRQHRVDNGRTSRVNLTFTGRMLSSLTRGVRAYKNRATITLTGEQGFKAYMLEEGKRDFFGISEKRSAAIYKAVLKWMTRKNNLK